MLQLILLAAFALCAVLCFWFRLRVGMLEGACARGEKSGQEAAPAIARLEQLAKASAICSAACLALCIAVGAAQRFI